MFGEYGFFVLSAYAVTGAVIGGLIAWTLAVGRARRRELEEINED